MNQRALLFLFAVVGLTGCNPMRTDTATPEAETVAIFKDGKGVLFSEETRKLFGVEIAEAAEKPVRQCVQKVAQVYRPGGDGSPCRATLLLGVDESKVLKVGQPVSLKAAHRERVELTGWLVRLDAQAYAALGQVEALVEFSDPQQQCAVGTFLTATFTNAEVKFALVVPESALLTAADGCYVYTVNGSHFTRTRVKAGTASDGFIAIEDGLYAGDSVAAKGVESLWLVELSALKGGTPCCAAPKKNAEK